MCLWTWNNSVCADIVRHRTDTEYDDALIGKLFCFSFVNSYASLFFIAFIKSNMGEECNGPCMVELAYQLTIIFGACLLLMRTTSMSPFADWLSCSVQGDPREGIDVRHTSGHEAAERARRIRRVHCRYSPRRDCRRVLGSGKGQITLQFICLYYLYLSLIFRLPTLLHRSPVRSRSWRTTILVWARWRTTGRSSFSTDSSRCSSRHALWCVRRLWSQCQSWFYLFCPPSQAPILAYISNHIEIRSDGWKLLYMSK